jgi:hypothetical protein
MNKICRPCRTTSTHSLNGRQRAQTVRANFHRQLNPPHNSSSINVNSNNNNNNSAISTNTGTKNDYNSTNSNKKTTDDELSSTNNTRTLFNGDYYTYLADSIESSPPTVSVSDSEGSTGHEYYEFFSTKSSTNSPELESESSCHALQCASGASGDRSTRPSTDRASELELASSLNLLKSTSIAPGDCSTRPRTDRASELELASSLSQLSSASTQSESDSDNYDSDNESPVSCFHFNTHHKSTIGRVNKTIYQLDKTLNQLTTDHLTFYYANSLNNKLSSLNALAAATNPTVIAISET